MSSRLQGSGPATSLVLVGFMLLAIPAGMALVQGVTTTQSATITDTTITPTLPPLNLTATSAPTLTPTDSEEPPQDDDNKLLVDGDEGGLTDGAAVEEEEDCPEAKYEEIQEAINDASKGDTVIVCEGQYNPVNIGTPNITLRAHGGAEIISQLPDQPAVRSNATQVTIRGFTMRAPQASYVLTVGGPRTLIRNNTVHVSTNESTGIYLSDGLTPHGGEPEPVLRAATGSRVLKNTVNVTRSSEENELYRGIFTDVDRTVVQENTVFANDYTIAIRSSGNRTIISDNTINNPTSCRQEYSDAVNPCHTNFSPAAILIGDNGGYTYSNEVCKIGDNYNNRTPKHNWARQNLVESNYVSFATGEGLAILGMGNHSKAVAVTEGIVVRHNTFYQSGEIGGWSNNALIRNNTMDVDNRRTGESEEAQGNGERGLCGHFDNSRIIGNSVLGYYVGMEIAGTNFTVKRNTVRDVFSPGMDLGSVGWQTGVHFQKNIMVSNNTITGAQYAPGVGLSLATKANFTEVAYNDISDNVGTPGVAIRGNVSNFHHNTITGNGQSGVKIHKNATVDGFHHNIIDNNQYLGINKVNTDKSDNRWSIFNATRNYWGCGGPSGGLQDPITNRTANGSGDPISASDEAGKSNVHFDPFFVREGLTCPQGESNTPESTQTSTPPTPTPTSTSTATPTSTPAAGLENGNGTGGTGGSGTGRSGGNGTDGTGGNGGTEGTVSRGRTTTATPPPETATPTLTSTPTRSPTPKVEPGFGLLAWLVGGILLSGIVALRRRVIADMEADE